jgi:hypothetical protein
MDKHRTTTIITLVVACFVLGLTGCDTDEPDSPALSTTTAPTESAEPIEPVDFDVDGVFIDTVRARITDVDDVPDEMLISLAGSICYGFDTGSTFDSLALLGITEGFSPYAIGSLIGASVAAYCPDHLDLIPT